MEIDVIILSNGLDTYFREMTQACINSCHDSEDKIKFNIIVYEQTDFKYYDCTTINYSIPFHYNRLMNMGLGITTNRYVALCNNDLEFRYGWATECIRIMEDYGVYSCSPNHQENRSEKKFRRGYGIGIGGEVKGWCIMCNRNIFDKIGKLDESVSFWFSDNVYADQLKKHKETHLLALDARVDHIRSQTIDRMPQKINHELTANQEKKYASKLPKDND